MLQKTSVWLGLLAVLSNVALPGAPIAADCTSALYKSLEFKQESERFSPYEKIFIKTRCSGLAAGEHTMHVNWIHHRRGLFRSDKHDFGMDIEGNRVVFFWFKLTKKGPFSSALSNSDFHEENFGSWRVEVYLGNEIVTNQAFEIQEGD